MPVSKNILNGPSKTPVVSDERVTVDESFCTPTPNGLRQFVVPKFAAVGAGCGIVAKSLSEHVIVRVFAGATAGSASGRGAGRDERDRGLTARAAQSR